MYFGRAALRMKTIHIINKQHKVFTICCLYFLNFYSIFGFNDANKASCAIDLEQTKLLVGLPTLSFWIDSIGIGEEPTLMTAQNFQSFEADVDFTSTEVAYWLKFSLSNHSMKLQEYWLDASVFDSLTLIQILEEDTITQRRGLLVQYTDYEKENFKSLQENKYGFKLRMEACTKRTIYLRIKNIVRFESSIKHITLSEKKTEITTAVVWNLIFNMIFFGILAFLALFSLFQYFQNKDLAYFFYFAYLSTCNLYMWWKFEKSNSFVNLFFTNNPEWYYYIEIPTCLAVYSSYLFFLIHFINAKTQIPFFYKLLKGTAIAIVIYLIFDRLTIQYWGFAFSWQLYFIWRLLLAVAAIAAFYVIFKSQTTLAIYLLSGSFVVLIGSCITAYYSKTLTQHYWNSWDIPLLPIQMAILIEAFLFSTGLGYKARLAEREKTKLLQNLKSEQKEKEYQKTKRQQLTKWFANITHELRTPLTIIGGMTQQIKERPTYKVKERLELIKNNTNSLLELINQLLDLSKLEAGFITINNQQQDIIPYLRFLIDSFQSIAFDNKIMLSFYAQKSELWMDYDKEKIKRIVINLLSNALKFTPEYGKILIELIVGSPPTIEAQIEGATNAMEKDSLWIINEIKENDQYLLLKIQDSGSGIPKKDLPYVFDRFYQPKYTLVQEGTGLGLALVKELMQLMNGSIHIKSTFREGTLITIALPITQKAQRITAKPQTINRSSKATMIEAKNIPKESVLCSKKSNILIVEDSKDVIYYLRACLETKYHLSTARDGQEGWEKAKESLPDLIVSDVMMPKMDGFAF